MAILLKYLTLVLFSALCSGEIINRYHIEDHCITNPCGQGNTCFNTAIGYKCFCRPGEESPDCVQEEKCLLYNNTGICRDSCDSGETGIYISHLGDRFMDLRVYNQDGNVTVANNVPVEDVKLQVPCMWQLTGKPNCCVKDEDAKIGCFAYGSTVRTQNRGVIPVEQVKTGDVVESLSESNTVIYAPVIMIMHQEPERVEEMVTITTTPSDSHLTLTHDHLLKVSTDVGHTWTYIFSERAKPGMLVITTSEEGIAETETIQTVTRENRQGLYAPVTTTGNIIVDSVVASCYGNHPDHSLSHMVFAPIRWAFRLAPWMYNGDSVTADGSHPYVSFLDNNLRALTGNTLLMSQHRLDAMTAYP